MYTQQYTNGFLKSANVKKPTKQQKQNNNESLIVCFGPSVRLKSNPSAEEVVVLFRIKGWHRLFGRAYFLVTQRRFPGRWRHVEPRVSEQLSCCESLRGFFPQQALEQTLGLGRQTFRQTALASANFGKKCGRVRVVEGVAADQHRVQHDPEAPHVGHLAGVRRGTAEDLWADVGRAAVGVWHRVILGVLQNAAVLKAF